MASSATPIPLKVLLGNYPDTLALKRGEVRARDIALDFTEIEPVHAGFDRTVRDLEFDISELALVTFLLAKAAGVPLVLLPMVTFSRPQQPYLVYNARRGVIRPSDLPGKTLACRLYSSSTCAWLRGILMSDYGIDPASIRWLGYEPPHLSSYHDPAFVQPAPKDIPLARLLLEGHVDAAIIDPVPQDPDIRPVFADPDAAGRAWEARHHAIQINHMVVARASLSREHPGAVRSFFRLARESRARAPSGADQRPTPYGLAAMRHSLEVAIDMVHRQGMIPRRYTVDELFDDVTRPLA
jgi:4,5-dihydroxyphthalate decarboxylase